MNAVERDDVYNPIRTLGIQNLFNVEGKANSELSVKNIYYYGLCQEDAPPV